MSKLEQLDLLLHQIYNNCIGMLEIETNEKRVVFQYDTKNRNIKYSTQGQRSVYIDSRKIFHENENIKTITKII